MEEKYLKILNQFETGEFDQVISLINQYDDLPQEDYIYLKGIEAAALNNINKPDEAIEISKEILKLETQENFKTYYRLAYSYFLKEDFQNGIPAVNKALELNPEYEDNYWIGSHLYLFAIKENKKEYIRPFLVLAQRGVNMDESLHWPIAFITHLIIENEFHQGVYEMSMHHYQKFQELFPEETDLCQKQMEDLKALKRRQLN